MNILLIYEPEQKLWTLSVSNEHYPFKIKFLKDSVSEGVEHKIFMIIVQCLAI